MLKIKNEIKILLIKICKLYTKDSMYWLQALVRKSKQMFPTVNFFPSN